MPPVARPGVPELLRNERELDSGSSESLDDRPLGRLVDRGRLVASLPPPTTRSRSNASATAKHRLHVLLRGAALSSQSVTRGGHGKEGRRAASGEK